MTAAHKAEIKAIVAELVKLAGRAEAAELDGVACSLWGIIGSAHGGTSDDLARHICTFVQDHMRTTDPRRN